LKRKNGECAACLKYSVLIVVGKKYIKCNIWRVAIRPSYIQDARFLKVKWPDNRGYGLQTPYTACNWVNGTQFQDRSLHDQSVNTVSNVGYHKILGTLSLAGQILGSQEELCPIKLEYIIKNTVNLPHPLPPTKRSPHLPPTKVCEQIFPTMQNNEHLPPSLYLS